MARTDTAANMSFGSFLQRIQKGLSTVELIHVSHPRWPIPPGSFTSPTLHISVLDSSFNPPTLAHLALATTPPPPNASLSAGQQDFDARLLLLSVRNADKQLKPGDATHEQRAEMMVLLAAELARSSPRARSLPNASSEPPAQTHDRNVAVAIIDEPTFVGKSAILLDFLRQRISDLQQQQPSGVVLSSPPEEPPSPKLTFLMGTDTIVRFFAPRYYADEHAMTVALRRFLSPDENDSRIICARRVSKGLSTAEEVEVESQLPAFVSEILPTNRISFVDIGEQERTYSSSEVREMLASHQETWNSMVPRSIAEYIVEHNLYSPSSS
ncbi:hypothetical protein BD310DRAFT_917338 [Dichomitus squalens]|uniref:Nicotinamide-nucleotide adenylyltransferase n=1 Tax=Dichomitus squalens TaxID=114155 RepID=A0A4Q9Q6D2_9APHY|nr:hypothetical protein BD310DRAFT_917338 [Dichomitus squalens]